MQAHGYGGYPNYGGYQNYGYQNYGYQGYPPQAYGVPQGYYPQQGYYAQPQGYYSPQDSYTPSYGAGGYPPGTNYQQLVQQQSWQMQQALQTNRQQGQNLQMQRQNSQRNHDMIFRGQQRADGAILGGVGANQLNKEEFAALTVQQNRIYAALTQFSADGVLTAEETAVLSRMNADMRRNLAQYKAEDLKPQIQPANEIEQRDMALAGKLYDMVKSGKLSAEDARALQAQMTTAAQYDGQEAGQAPQAYQERMLRAQERRQQIEMEMDSVIL
jgi:polyhydroxyalkanoate synthesis regulator phasin